VVHCRLSASHILAALTTFRSQAELLQLRMKWDVTVGVELAEGQVQPVSGTDLEGQVRSVPTCSAMPVFDSVPPRLAGRVARYSL
jgi:hypothetical protein